jgi:hypothetical protein
MPEGGLGPRSLAQAQPRVSEEGLSIVRRWAEEFLRKHPAVESGEEAPMTSAKQDLIKEGRSEGERLAHGLALEALGRSPVVLKVAEVTTGSRLNSGGTSTGPRASFGSGGPCWRPG